MPSVVKDRGASGHGSIMFRQDLDYPRIPGQITYYPPEPSEELQRQVRRDKAGGLALYIIGFAVALIGFMAAMEFSRDVEIYAVLIPFLLVLGLVFAIMYLVLDNVTLAKLSRSMPMILMVCLILLYVVSIISAINDLVSTIDGGSENAVSSAFEDLYGALLNPAFFFMSAGLIICRAGGTMLWTSTKVVHEYIPGMIILETAAPGSQQAADLPEEQHHIEEYAEAQPQETRPCPSCGQPLTYIPQYGRYYCYNCNAYPPED